MNKSKKLFNSEDFDKKKALFEPEDFDKPVEENEKGRIESSNSPYSSKKLSKTKIICSLVVVIAIITGAIFFANKDNGSNKPMKEATAQEGKKHDADNKVSQTDPKGKVKVAPSDAPKEKSADDNTKYKSSAAEESYVTTSKGQLLTTSSEKSENNVGGDVETNARRVIRGDFGNGQERRDKLGSSYSEIQGKVNEMYRQGLVH